MIDLNFEPKLQNISTPVFFSLQEKVAEEVEVNSVVVLRRLWNVIKSQEMDQMVPAGPAGQVPFGSFGSEFMPQLLGCVTGVVSHLV